VVTTDRQVLDRQLQDAIYQIEHAQGVVKAIDQDAKQLAAALIDGTKIVITTLQKFPFVLRGLLHAAGAESQERATELEKQQAVAWEAEIAKRRYAVIVDEAHSSQSGETARELKSILGGAAEAKDVSGGEGDEGALDWEDGLNQVMQSRGQQPNLSFFAFTATPKGKTLELFGRTGASGLPEAFHLYSMRQAIEEGFILDVVQNYTTSGTVKDPDTGVEYTEPGMNVDLVSGQPISEKQLVERFASSDYQVLLVANKYQTGFDQPLLCAMYVDKRLDGVQAVQTLSRVNRMIPGKQSPFVLDFVNEAEDIYWAFKPYYDATSLQERSDPQQLEALKHELDAAQVYFWSEVDAYAKVFCRPAARQTAADHAQMEKQLQPAVDRFKSLGATDAPDDDRRGAFREKLSGYVSLYSFLSQILPYGDPDLEMLYTYGRFLLPHLSLGDTERVKLGDEVGLQFYRLQRISSGPIT
jgi:type I site-specific restriction-modification system R (restriction) subunit